MSDTAAPAPEVFIATTRSGSLVALLHLGDKLRQVFAGSPADMARRIGSACISEFRMSQEAAEQHAEDVVTKHVDGANALVEHINVLQGQLGDTQAEHEGALANVADAEKQIAVLQEHVGELEKAAADEAAALRAIISERDAKIEVLEKQIADLRNNAAGAEVANKNPGPDAGSAAGGTVGTAETGASHRTDEPPARLEDGAGADAERSAPAAATEA